MMNYVSVESRPDGVAVLRFDRPPVNAISTELAGEIREAALALAADEAVKAVVVTGSEKVFAAGADVTEFETDGGAVRLPDAVKAAGFALSSIPRPVIAAISGYAFGAGLEIAMSCDLRVMADTTRVGQPEILLGLFPGASGTQRLSRLVGAGRAKDIIFSGRH